MKIQLEKSQEELQKYRSSQRMEEVIERLIRNLWRKQFTKSFSKVKDRINQYLKNMTIDMRVKSLNYGVQVDAVFEGGRGHHVLNANFTLLNLQESSQLNV